MTQIKHIALLLIMSDDALLVQKSPLDDYEILSLPGTSIADGVIGANAAKLKAQLILGEGDWNINSHGTFKDTIIRPDKVVEINAEMFRIVIDGTKKIGLKLGANDLWLTKSEIENDIRARRDTQLFARAFENKPFDVQCSEDQPARWIDARMLWWKEGN